ncbi:putative alpha/beta hydrolase family esterase [Mycoplana sp. BE70]|uniref:RBBP9/YdeN family alpha/beta hydrolase n=1 Tax=Mycoplana sp. BE70 TaxID=2817775 RepID=UPI0028666A4B|nr:alpha/beta fold hydrolase [Mycoplana sp. BE70]MDR6758134.1 putative alpha/beta hydrolase family esterase [Mycoplana sp. BE70]
MAPVLILPGLFGSGEGHWQRHWLADRPESLLVEQDNWDRPVLSEWLEKLENVLEQVEDAYIVAHSLGCVLAARHAQRASARKIKGALLVATCDLQPTERFHPGHVSFGPMPTHRLPFPTVMVGSLNDPYMTIDRQTLFTRLWGAEHQSIGSAGHINIASGYGRWTNGYALFDCLKRKVASLRNSADVN